MKRRQFLVAGAAALGTDLASAAQDRTAPANLQRELRLALAAEAGTVDPHFAALMPNVNLAQHLFDALVHVDAAGGYVPGLATSWRTLDPVTWELKLRPGVMFHDGSRLSPDDVLFSLQRPARAINSPGPLTTFTRQILETKVIDSSTLHIKTREPYGGLLGDLTSLFIVSKAAAERASPAEFDSGKAAIGTGPFRLITFEKGKEVKLERHDSYWGGPPPWQQVTLLFMPDEKQRTAALTSKQVDAIEGVPPTDIPALRAQAGVQLVQRTSWRTIFLHLEQFTDRSPWILDAHGHPVERSPLKDRRVRRAMSLALDRPAMIRTHLQGLAEPAGQLVAPGVLGYSKTLKPDSFDPVNARRLLAQAGYGEGFTITMHGPKNRYIYDEQICQAVGEQWASIGIRTRVETLPAAQYFARARQGEFSVAMLGYGSLAGDFALRALLGTPDSAKGWGTWNWSKFSNRSLDNAVKESLRATDIARRQQQAAAAMEIAMTERAVVPLHHQIASWAVRAGLTYVGRIDEFTLAHQFKPVATTAAS